MIQKIILVMILLYTKTSFALNNNQHINIDKNIAILDTKNVIEKSDIGKKAQQLIDKYQQDIMNKVNKYQFDLEAKKDDLQKEQVVLPKQSLKEKELAIQKLYEIYIKEIDELKSKNIIYQQKLVSKVLEKVNMITEEISQEESLNIVFDKMTVLYVNKSNDITEEVIKRLNNKYKDTDIQQ